MAAQGRPTAPPAPTAVKALVALMVTQVVLGLVSIPLAFSHAQNRLRDSLAASGSTIDVNTIKTIAVVFGVVFGALYVALALVILRGRRWAWITALVLVSLGLLSALSTLGNADNRTALTPVSAVVLVAIFVLLLSKPVRHHVDPRRGGPPLAPQGYPQQAPGWGQPQPQGQPGYPQAPPPAYPQADQPGYPQAPPPPYPPPPGPPTPPA